MKITEIPIMTHKLSRYWDQPPTEQIAIDDIYAMMTQETLDNLAEYSMSTPTGTYQGKMWKTIRSDGKVFLRWYQNALDPTKLAILSREIIIVGDKDE